MENLKENASECKKKFFQLTRSNKSQLKNVCYCLFKIYLFKNILNTWNIS